jgi:Tfp pilus assembly protein PilF
LTRSRLATIIPRMQEEPIRRRSLSGSRSPRAAPERWGVLILIAALAALAATVAASPRHDPVSLSSAQRAALAHKWALEGLTDSTVEGRQRARRDIELAIRLEPNQAEHWLVLGKLQVLEEYDDLSRASFRRAMILDPTDPEAYLELAASWKRDALRTLDTLAFIRAMGVLDTAASLRRAAVDPWVQLVALRYEAHDYAGAARAAEHALAGRPRRPEAALAAAYVAFHDGDYERSDSLFRVAIPRLDPALRAFFEDPSTVFGARAPRGDWEGLDPDPTTPENELQLEYWSRVSHAFLLFNDPERPGMDIRFQTYVQYGSPRFGLTNPNGIPLYFRSFASNVAPHNGSVASAGGNPGKPPMEFPTPTQMWVYPDLGMSMVMQDRSLHGHYMPQATEDFDPASRPDPGIVASRDDLVGLGGGIAVFHRLPPREQRIDPHAVVARFGGGATPRLLAQLEVAGSPADSLVGRWVALDPFGHARARGEARLGTAACDPAERRGIQFTAELPPGTYEVSLSVHGAGGRRGLYQTRVVMDPEGSGFGLSDLVLACGDPSLLVGRGSARFDANVDQRSTGSMLVAYLEIYRLASGTDGVSHFEYQCDVRALTPPGKKPPKVEAPPVVSISREDTHVGAIRRQFVSVPVEGLTPGRYLLQVRVRDQVSGLSATRTAAFVRE